MFSKIMTTNNDNKKSKSLVEIKQIKAQRKSTKLTAKSALFIRDQDGIFVVSKKFLKELSFDQAVAIGLSTLIELRTLMVGDAMTNGETRIENVEVTAGLNNTLSELEVNYPTILKHIYNIEPEFSSIKVYHC